MKKRGAQPLRIGSSSAHRLLDVPIIYALGKYDLEFFVDADARAQ